VLAGIVVLLFPTIMTELHKRYYWISRPGYLNYAFVQEVETIIGDESFLITDRDRAIGYIRGLGDSYGRIRIRDFPDNTLLSPDELFPNSPFGWLCIEDALSSGFDFRFEIILRGHDKTLTLVPVNIDLDYDLKFRRATLLVLETEQLITTIHFSDYVFLLHNIGLPVGWPYFLANEN